MPAFEGLILGTERPAVVFDIGRAYTKCGFAGESGPRCIVPSQVKRPRSSEVTKLFISNVSDDQLYNILVDFVHFMYFRHLLVNPKERRVVIVESILSSTTNFRNTLAKVLFQHFEVPSLLFLSSHAVSVITLGIPSGLVVDCGYEETVVLPVCEGAPLLNAWQALPQASRSIHQYLAEQMKETGMLKVDQNTEVPLSTVVESLSESILEDIKVRTCFVTKLERARKIQQPPETTDMPSPPPGVEYPLEGNKILLITGKLRETACEVLFERDADDTSVASIILESLIKCPLDTRRTLAENIIVIGGTSMLPGFKHRLMTELQDLVATPKYRPQLGINTFKFHSPPAKDNCVAWLGGAMFASLEVVGARSLPRDQYLKGVPLPDWCVISASSEKTASTN